ncbi:3-hydroxyacyl-ACP dehydratase FabZ [Holzapfeliella sp. He02]|uniref:3-hydroxyacyl-ACP dehydratase FabZ n=1 Tax=Holzapfeliella saturejae TaxID=3082953 RepID=A0ABU8SHQ4_9LACO
MTQYSNHDVFEAIPQRYPFMMIDTIKEINPGQNAIATKNVTINEWFFKSQNPDHLEMPRPLIIEALAQTGVCALLSQPEFEGKNAFFGGIKSAEFSDGFYPGDELTLEVKLTKIKRNIGLGTGQVVRDNKVICEAELMFAIQ